MPLTSHALRVATLLADGNRVAGAGRLTTALPVTPADALGLLSAVHSLALRREASLARLDRFTL